MKNLARVFLSVVLAVLLLAAGAAMFIETVPVAKIGVKQSLWGGGGIVERDYATGFHIGITGYHKWYLLDKRTHFLTFADQGARYGQEQSVGALEIRTKDNNLVSFDLTVTYRLVAEEAYMMVKNGQQNIYRERLVPVVEKVLREQLAQLSSEDIYSTEKRVVAAGGVLPTLRKAMGEYHVEPETLLIRAVRFSPDYEEKLQAKQLTYQKRLLAQSEKLVEDEAAITEKLRAEIGRDEKELRGDWGKKLEQVAADNKVTIAEILGEAAKYDAGTRGEASADFETLMADGRLAVDKSEALRNELRNKALDTQGGRIYLARQAAENLNFEHVTLNSNDPNVPSILNIDELVKVLVGTQE